jgi:hypothetical protein
MFRNAMTVKFFVLMMLLVTAAMLVGVDPWGPG